MEAGIKRYILIESALIFAGSPQAVESRKAL